MVTVIPVVATALGTIPKGLVKRMEALEIRGKVEIIQTTAMLKQSTEKSPGDLRRHADTKTTEKNHQLPLVGKIIKD